MNRSKQPIFNKLGKQIAKAIRHSRDFFLSAQELEDQDTLTAQEISKKFPKKYSRKKTELAEALKKKKQRLKKEEKSGVGLSKRTTPGSLVSDSTPASVHPEGARWIKTLSKQTKNERVIAAHHGKR